MIIISHNVKVSEKDVAQLSNRQLIISNVITAHGTDYVSISIEKEKYKDN